MDIKIRQTVWFRDSTNQVESGTVIDMMIFPPTNTKIACVKTRAGYRQLDIDSRRMWTTQASAFLALGESKQTDASRLLVEAAQLFRQAGGIRDIVSIDDPTQGNTNGRDSNL